MNCCFSFRRSSVSRPQKTKRLAAGETCTNKRRRVKTRRFLLAGVLTFELVSKPGRESSEANRGRKGGAREWYEKSPPFWVGIMSGADFAPTWLGCSLSNPATFYYSNNFFRAQTYATAIISVLTLFSYPKFLDN